MFILPELLENPSGEVLNFLDRLDLNPESGVTTTTAITGLSEDRNRFEIALIEYLSYNNQVLGT